MSRKKLISMTTATQFQTPTSEITNLDRCNLCGATRAAHGIDWTCSTGTPVRHAHMIAVIAIAGVLAIAGVVILTVTSTTGTSLGSVAAAACLGGLTVLICAAEIIRRRGQERGSATLR
jgi:hypothetical protein